MIIVPRVPFHLRLTQVSARLSLRYHLFPPAQSTRVMATRSYADAVDKLNSLQSNAATLEALRNTGGRMNDLALPEMIEYLQRIGHSVSLQLRCLVNLINSLLDRGSKQVECCAYHWHERKGFHMCLHRFHHPPH